MDTKKKVLKKKRAKQRKRRRIVSITIISLIILLIVFLVSINSTLGRMKRTTIDDKNLEISDKFKTSDTYTKEYRDVVNIAFFGLDEKVDDIQRSDAIMIGTLDPINNKIKITSFMRDSYVDIPDYGYDKLNHAYAYGGAPLAIRTLNENFGLNIEDFVSVNFSSLPQIIDILGGITIDITEEEISHIPGVSSTGPTLLTGKQALAYSRIRYASGDDYERTHRHRNVMSAVFTKALNAPPKSYPNILNNILPLVQTNLSSGDFVSLATKVVGLGSGNLEQERFPRDGDGTGDMSTGIYYLKFDIETVKKQMRDYIFNDKK
ncbi:MAG TPA: LytR family transcriptional regulator [Clostridium sp.]|nr:LytR family transcriptional regulator [Clostridium sp.]